MPETDFETAIADFLAMGRRLQAAQPITGERVLDELTTWYREHRVLGAAIDDDADMLLLQWGATRPLILAEPTDLRSRGDEDLKFADANVQYLDFTRQVMAAGVDEEAEFDDAAVQMSITLGFALAAGNEPNANLWINTPDDIDSGTASFVGTPFVASHLSVPAKTIAISVGFCG